MTAETARVIYSFVARKSTVLVEHATSLGNFRSVALQCLESLPSGNKKFSLSQKGYTLNYLLEDNFSFMVLCDKNVPQPVCFDFLETLKTEFIRDFRAAAESAGVSAFQQDYGARLQEHMKNAEDAAEIAMKKESKDSQESQEVIVAENAKKAEAHEKQLKELEKKMEKAKDFKERSKEIQRKIMWERCAVLIILIVVLTLACVIWVTVCHGLSCHMTNRSTF